MDRYPDILEDILHFDEDSDDEWDMLLAETKREEESRSKRRNKHRGSVPFKEQKKEEQDHSSWSS